MQQATKWWANNFHGAISPISWEWPAKLLIGSQRVLGREREGRNGTDVLCQHVKLCGHGRRRPEVQGKSSFTSQALVNNQQVWQLMTTMFKGWFLNRFQERNLSLMSYSECLNYNVLCNFKMRWYVKPLWCCKQIWRTVILAQYLRSEITNNPCSGNMSRLHTVNTWNNNVQNTAEERHVLRYHHQPEQEQEHYIKPSVTAELIHSLTRGPWQATLPAIN